MSSTPILDRLEPLPELVSAAAVENAQKPRSRLRNIIIVLFVVVGTGLWISFMIWSPYASRVADVLSARLDRLFPGAYSSTASFLLILLLWCLLPLLALCYAVIVHECGHLLAGLCAGFRLISIRFGPIEIRPRFRLSLQRKPEPGLAGSVRMLPGSPTALLLRATVMTIGGPAANLACAILVPLFVGESLVGAWFVVMSYIMGISNLVPFHIGSFDSDGMHLLNRIRGDRREKRQFAILQLYTDLNNGVALEDLHPKWLAMATSICDDSLATMLAHLVAYWAAWDTRKPDEQAQILETVLEYSKFAPPVFREILICDAATFQARKRRRADLAQQWLADLPEKLEFPERRLRIEAAILEAQDDPAGALAKVEEYKNAVVARSSRTQKKISLKSLERWRAELQEKVEKKQLAVGN